MKFSDFLTYFTETIFRRDVTEWRNPVVRWLVQQYRLLFYTARGLLEHGTIVRSAALTFYTLMSLVPIVAVVFAVVKGFGLADGLVDWHFTLVRVIAFYTFYECGVLLRPQLDRLAAFAAEHRPVRLVAAAGLVLGYGAYFLWVLRADPIMDHSAELFHDVSYAGGDRGQYRGVCSLVGIATTAALTVLACRWYLLAGLGRHTLTSYLLHLPVPEAKF